jgi:hypothetical protein
MRASVMRAWHFGQRSRSMASSGIAAGKSAMVLHVGSGVSVKRLVTGRHPGTAVTNQHCASGGRRRWSILVNFRNKRSLLAGRSTHDRRAKRHLTSGQLDPPSNAIALQVPAIHVRWFDRMRVRRISRNSPPSGDTSRTTRTRGRFEMRAFCCSPKKGGSTTLSVAGKSRAHYGDRSIYNLAARNAVQYCSNPDGLPTMVSRSVQT